MASTKIKDPHAERDQGWFNELFKEHGWTIHEIARRWYPPLADGTPHTPDADGKPTVNTTQFLHTSDVTAFIESGTTDELITLIVKWGKPVAG